MDTDDCGLPDLRFRGILVIYDDLLLCKTSRVYVVTSGVYDIVNDIEGIGVVIVACYKTPSWTDRGNSIQTAHHGGRGDYYHPIIGVTISNLSQTYRPYFFSPIWVVEVMLISRPRSFNMPLIS